MSMWQYQNFINDKLKQIKKVISLQDDNTKTSNVYNNTSGSLTKNDKAKKQIDIIYNDLFMQNSHSFVILLDKELDCVCATSSAIKFFGYRNTGELKTLPAIEIFSQRLDSNWVERLLLECHTVLKSHRVCCLYDTIELNECNLIHAQVVIAPIIDLEKACAGLFFSLEDQTELHVMKSKVDAAIHCKQDFLAIMSHELRTPMNAIKGFSELLVKSGLTQAQHRYVEHIDVAANSLLNIFTNVLEYAAFERGDSALEEDEYNVMDLLNSVANLSALWAGEKGLDLFININVKLPSRLYGDAKRIKQVLLGLLSNAVKYTKSGFVELAATGYTSDDSSLIAMEFMVSDSGMGIKPEYVAGLFDPFARINTRQNRTDNGAGAGLVHCRQLARSLGGDIAVESVYGSGSSFTLLVQQRVVDTTPIHEFDLPQGLQLKILGDFPLARHLQCLLSAHGLSVDVITFTTLASAVSSSHALMSAVDSAEDITAAGDIKNNQISADVFIYCYPLDVTLLNFLETANACQFVCICKHGVAAEGLCHAEHVLHEPVLITELLRVLNRCASALLPEWQQLGGVNVTSAHETLTAQVLVVDDNSVNLMIAEEMLCALGVDVDKALSGEAAIEKCKHKKFDIIFMDYMMPGMDGVEAMTIIKRYSTTNCKTPVIALTANTVAGTKEFLLEKGMDGFLSKPIDMATLTNTLQRWVAPKIAN